MMNSDPDRKKQCSESNQNQIKYLLGNPAGNGVWAAGGATPGTPLGCGGIRGYPNPKWV